MGDDAYGINRADDRPHRRRDRARSCELGVRGRHRHRRRQHLPRRGARRGRHGPRDRRLHGHARHADERARAAGRDAPGRHRVARAVGAAHRPGRRALRPRPRRCGISRKARSSSSPPAPATRSSRPTPRPRCAAREMGVEIVLKATKVDGVYTADPKKDPTATPLRRAQLRRGDRQESAGDGRDRVRAVPRPELPIKVFSIFVPGALKRVVMGEDEGTLVHC